MQREDLSRNFGFILHDVARLLRMTYDRRMKALGLTRSQWWVLTHLYRNDGATQSELADMLEIEKPTLGRLLDRLESNGWVRREEHSGDRRAKRVFLTDEVEPAMKAMRTAAAEMRRDALAGLSVDAQNQFVDTLLAVKANLGGNDAAAAKNGSLKSGSARNGATKNGMVKNGAAKNAVTRTASAKRVSVKTAAASTGETPHGGARNALRAKGQSV